MDKAKKINGKLTKFIKLELLNGDCVITSLKQINTIAESECLIVITRYSQIHSNTFREVMPIVINPKYVISAERVDGWLTQEEGQHDKQDN
ncbi:MAG TPA: hypothetical protein K8V21_00575 [Weissella thailandensis]|uniref:hypothetical protein n=1 Tax=Weissella thailandensis TaxID=89061 RepID=UPI001DE0C96D|nr:hypothetical protein [Weissella thailandensis]HJG83899.1 hypothetical protein [Weissella thailandensis]